MKNVNQSYLSDFYSLYVFLDGNCLTITILSLDKRRYGVEWLV